MIVPRRDHLSEIPSPAVGGVGQHGGMTPRFGFTFTPTLPPERLRDVARAVETAGLDDLWVWEDCFKESGIASAAVALASTERIRVGIGLLPAPLRTVALTAMEIATLDRIFPGRLLAGVGHGVQSWMGQTGTRVDSPMTLLREYAEALRRLLDGERVTVSGRYVTLDDVALDWPPLARVPLALGGEGPKSLRLCGELGDETILTSGLTDARVGEAIATTRHAAGDPGHPVVASLMVATGADAQQRLDAERRMWHPDAVVETGVAGNAEQVAAAARRLLDLGATTLTFQPLAEEPDYDGLIAFLGADVRPLLV